MRIADWLARARAMGVDRLDAQLLLAHRLGRSRAWLIAHEDDPGPAPEGDAGVALEVLLAQRAAGAPLAYLVGEREFHGLALAVGPAVLVPRPETEGLVDWALEIAGQPGRMAAAFVDLGTGSGAIALAFKRRAPAWQVCASDASPGALALARANAQRHHLDVAWFEGDWWAPLGGRRFAIAVSNPPYVAEGDPHLAALAHEPHAALVAADNGLAALRAIVVGAPSHLLPGAWLLLEHGRDQAASVGALLAGAGFTRVETRRDLAGHDRCTGAMWPDGNV